MINEKKLKTWSILSFFVAIVSLIIVDWYFHGYGVLIMFVFISMGLIFNQLSKIYFPIATVSNYVAYKNNKLLKLLALILFVMSPMALIYGNQMMEKLGIVTFVLLIGIGIVLDQIAGICCPFSKLENCKII